MTCMKHGDAAVRTCGIYMDMEYGHVTWRCVQHGNAEWIIRSMDIEHAAWTCRKDMEQRIYNVRILRSGCDDLKRALGD